jgi:hypothetical protein
LAIKDLKEKTKTKIIPIFEIIQEEEIKPEKIISSLKSYIPKYMPVILDFAYLDNDENNDLNEFIFSVVNNCKSNGFNIIPMSGIGRSNEYDMAISETSKYLYLS